MITAKNEGQFLSAILQLMGRLVSVPREEAGFVLLNEAAALIPFRIGAVFFQGDLVQLSSTDRVVESSPVTTQFRSLYGDLTASMQGSGQNVTNDQSPLQMIQNDYEHPGQGVLFLRVGETDVIFTRDIPDEVSSGDTKEAFSEHEIATLTLLVRTFEKVVNYRPRKRINVKRPALWAGLAVLLLSFAPLHTSTHERAEVGLYQEASIRSSAAGVISSIDVEPDESVRKGDVLLHFDNRQILADLQVARDGLAAARSQYGAFLQQGMGGDEHARNQILIQQHHIQEEKDRVAYQEALLSKTVLRSPVDGVAVFNDKASLVGKSVALGESIMSVSKPDSYQLRIFVPNEDIISFHDGSPVRFFDYVRPLHAYHGKISYTPYRPTVRPDQTLVHEYRATLDEPDRPGLGGTAVIAGERVPLIMWLLRKPLSFMRNRAG